MGFHITAPIPDNATSRPRMAETSYPRSFRVRYGLRHYSPTLARWTSRDPIGEEGFWAQARKVKELRKYGYGRGSFTEKGLYTFVGNLSIGRIDAFGLMANTWVNVSSPCYKCGPQVPSAMFRELFSTVSERWGKLSVEEKATACRPFDPDEKSQQTGIPIVDLIGVIRDLPETYIGINGWDIQTFMDPGRFSSKKCGTGKCAETIWIDDTCYNAHEANYVLYGWLNRFCGITKEDMLSVVSAWKLMKDIGWLEDQREGAIDWARSGYDLWPIKGEKPRGQEKYEDCGDCGEKIGVLKLVSSWPGHSLDRRVW
jgi:hypothetical protein